MGVPVYWDLSALCVFVCVCLCVCVFVRSNQSTSKKPHYVSDLSKLIVCTPPPFLLGVGVGVGVGMGVGGLSLLSNFQKGGGLKGSQFLEGGCWERGGDFFSGRVAVFTKKN